MNPLTLCSQISTTVALVTEELYDEMLNVLPPIYGRGMFAVGEEHSWDYTSNRPIYHCFARIRGECYGVKSTIPAAETIFDGIRSNLNWKYPMSMIA